MAKKTRNGIHQYYTYLTEYERGWGSKVFCAYAFDTLEEAQAKAREINAQNTATVVPDYYIRADVSTDNYYAKFL